MDIFTLSMWVATGVFLIYSFRKNATGTKKALHVAFSMGKGMLGSILSIIFAIGLLLTIFPPEQIASTMEQQPFMHATIIGALFGTITLIPAFIAFPLVGTLVDGGVQVATAVAFLTTLTMVGVVTFPLEKKEFGLKFALGRNVLSFIFSIVIATIMGVFLS